MSGTEYGLFLPNAAGGWLISDTAPYPPADYDYNKRVARLGEQIEFAQVKLSKRIPSFARRSIAGVLAKSFR